MGCCVVCASKDAKEEIGELKLDELDRFEKVEHSIAPLHRIKIEAFEARVKKYVVGKSSISL